MYFELASLEALLEVVQDNARFNSFDDSAAVTLLLECDHAKGTNELMHLRYDLGFLALIHSSHRRVPPAESYPIEPAVI
jgi:hypothetical protein